MRTGSHWLGSDALDRWRKDRAARGLADQLDVVLLTHPRDEQDLPQMYPWTADLSTADRRAFTHHLQPVFGEVIETPFLNIGILFLPRFADELMHPRTRQECRRFLEEAGLAAVIATGARIVCLGGLLGALSGYGRRLATFAAEHGLVITTGHAMTATTVLETYLRAAGELMLDPRRARMAVLGVGSVGSAFARLLLRQALRPQALVLIDKPDRVNRLEVLAAELADAGCSVSVEVTTRDGQLSPTSACYDSRFVISAVSTPDIIDIDNVAPWTVLVDDSQPNCWSREAAWRRVHRASDIAPCEAGLVDAGSIGYRSGFPFPIAEMDGTSTSSIAWCCLAEGLLLGLDPSLPPTVGEPSLEGLERHRAAFSRFSFRTGRLQCGRHFLPVNVLREAFADRRAAPSGVLPVARLASEPLPPGALARPASGGALERLVRLRDGSEELAGASAHELVDGRTR